jgi:hypothetical protein
MGDDLDEAGLIAGGVDRITRVQLHAVSFCQAHPNFS